MFTMNPFSDISSASNQSTTSTSSKMSSCQCGRQADNFFSFDLPISRRGQFLQDSFFNSSYGHLDNTVRRIMERWGVTNLMTDRMDDTKLRLSNNLSRYRQLRSHNLKEEDQAVTVTSEANSHKIVMDVHDFVSGDLKVKVIGEREVMVEGCMETNSGDLSMSSNSFKRKFIVPQDTIMENITSVMSSDGVLTITAPRRVTQEQTGCLEIPIKLEGSLTNEAAVNSHNSSNSTSSTQTTNCSCQTGYQKQEAVNSSIKQSHGQKVPIQINTTLAENNHQSLTREATNTSESSQRAQAEVMSKVNFNAHNNMNQSKVQEEVQKSSLVNGHQNSVNDRGQSASIVHTENNISSNTSKAREVPVKMGSFLPITRKGQFFNDSYFDGIRQDFQSAINDVLTRWGEGSLLTQGWGDSTNHLDNNLNKYRQLRAHNLKVDNQAVNITSDENSHKIVMDVQDFAVGEVKVRVVGERDVVVEGRKETNDGDFVVSSNSFKRRFCLPQDTNMADVTSVISSDGVLTLIAPRVIKQLKSEATYIPIKVEGSLQTMMDNNVNSSKVTSLEAEIEKCCHDERNQQKTSSMKVNEDSSRMINSNINVCQQNNKSSTSSTNTDAEVSGKVGDFTSSEMKKNCENETVSKTCVESNMSSRAESVEKNKSLSSQFPRSSKLPITTRGNFFSDSFFKDTWQDFEEAMRDVVSRWGNLSSTTDDLTTYRSLRASDLRDETQAVKTSEDEINYKIVVDVKDFIDGGNINVNSVNDREVVVDGQVEREEGGTKFRKQFHRRFVLPRDIYLESVSSVMSSDGVLTITAPKKPVIPKIREMIIPVSIEEGIHKSESLNKVSEEHLTKNIDNSITGQRSEVGCSVQDARKTLSKVLSAVTSEQSINNQQNSYQGFNNLTQKDEGQRGTIIPVRLEEDMNDESHTQQAVQSTGQNITKEEEMERKSIKQSVQSSNCSAQSEIKSSFNNSVAEKELHTSSVAQQTKKQGHYSNNTDNLSLNQRNISDVSEQSEKSYSSRCLAQNKYVPIINKGHFLSDSFFEDTRKQFTNAVQEVLQNTRSTSSDSDQLSSYRSLLKRNPKLENQAVHVEEDQLNMKIILDVNEFVGGDVKVEVVEGKEIVVEGKAGIEEGTSASTLSFRRLFTLPRLTVVEGITSAMSSDGVLTITVPKCQQPNPHNNSNNNNNNMVTQTQSRVETQGAGCKGFEERSEKKETKESEGCSSHSVTSSYRSQQQYSSNDTL